LIPPITRRRRRGFTPSMPLRRRRRSIPPRGCADVDPLPPSPSAAAATIPYEPARPLPLSTSRCRHGPALSASLRCRRPSRPPRSPLVDAGRAPPCRRPPPPPSELLQAHSERRRRPLR
jgi:hypothetical protein